MENFGAAGANARPSIAGTKLSPSIQGASGSPDRSSNVGAMSVCEPNAPMRVEGLFDPAIHRQIPSLQALAA